MDDIFENTVEQAEKEIQSSNISKTDLNDLPEEIRDEYRNIESLVRMNPEVVDSPEYQQIMERIDSYQNSKDENTSNEEQYEEEYEEENEETSEGEQEVSDIEDPFGIYSSNKKAKKVEINFEVPEEMEDLLSSKYGVNDASTFFTSVDTWRTQAQERAEFEDKLEALTSDVQSLPPDLRSAISMWADDEDYTSVFTQGLRLDFASDFEDQDVESLVEHFLSDEYNRLVNDLEAEKIDEADFDKSIDLLARSTRKMFNGEKKALVEQRANYDAKQSEIQSKIKSSALSSVEALSKSYPNFSKSELNRLRSVLVEGRADSYIYNADGTYKEEAAEMVANMMFGGKMRETIEKLAMRRGESKANQEFVDSSPKKIRKSKSSGSRGAERDIKSIQHLSSVVQNDDPYSRSMD